MFYVKFAIHRMHTSPSGFTSDIVDEILLSGVNLKYTLTWVEINNDYEDINHEHHNRISGVYPVLDLVWETGGGATESAMRQVLLKVYREYIYGDRRDLYGVGAWRRIDVSMSGLDNSFFPTLNATTLYGGGNGQRSFDVAPLEGKEVGRYKMRLTVRGRVYAQPLVDIFIPLDFVGDII